MRGMILLLLLVGGFAVRAATESISASESSSELKMGDVLRAKKFEEDKRITDLELRAQAGSLSRYSFKAELSYYGSPINDLADPSRPNPDRRPGDDRTYMSGSIGIRDRLTSSTALNLYTGVKWFTPYQAMTNEPVERRPGSKTYDVANPGLSLDRTYALQSTQMRSFVRVSATTEDYYKNVVAQWAAAGLGQAVKYTPFNGRVILGAQLILDYYAYDRDYRPPTQVGSKTFQNDGNVSKYYVSFIPSFEYKITDSVNFNSSLGYSYQNLRSDNSWWRWYHQLSTWRVGLGWAITRDVYLNPYVNFFAESPAFNTASVNFNTVFSVF